MALRELEHIHLTAVGFWDEGVVDGVFGGGLNDTDVQST